MSKEDSLVMTFDPNTIEHLGIKMYSNLPTAVAELVANSYDACAKRVDVKLYDDGDKKIVVEDNGTGMSFDEINSYFLRIGGNRRAEGKKETVCNRIATGKKGLGKLAFFGIGDTIKIITKKDGEKVSFTLDWQDLMNSKGASYMPSFELDTCEKADTGTIIELTKLKRKTNFDIDELAYSLSKIFNFSDEAFKLFLHLNDGEPLEIDNKLKYENITSEFEWNIPQFGNNIDITYDEKGNVNGKIITTEKPLKPGLRGITLFANGRMINKPEFFSSTESSHFFSYTVGWLDVDFVDNWDEDVISTNRQSINWENDKTIELRTFLKDLLAEIQKDWRTKRKEKRTHEINEKTDIDLEVWYSHLPEQIRNKVEPLIFSIVNNSELPAAEYNKAVTTIHEFVPDYPYFHWRHLHPTIQAASAADYQNKDYYRAFIEAAKRFITATRAKSGSTNGTDSGMMGEVFGCGKTLSVSKNYKKPDGTDFNADTYESIEDGQKFLSMGIVAGGRNPVSHEEIKDLRDSGLFSEKDCLDGLSLLSHLLRRLEDA